MACELSYILQNKEKFDLQIDEFTLLRHRKQENTSSPRSSDGENEEQLKQVF
jgi:hypothetical protein